MGEQITPNIYRLAFTTFVDVLKVLFDSVMKNTILTVKGSLKENEPSPLRIEFGEFWWVMRSRALF